MNMIRDSLACAALVALAAGCATVPQFSNDPGDWMVVNLKTGAVDYPVFASVTAAAEALNTDANKTDSMAFRRVEAGYYYLQGRGALNAKIGQPYYIGLFPVTARQLELMRGADADETAVPQWLVPATGISYAELRGGPDVPATAGESLGDGPIARLNARVASAGIRFDLPAEAMWEVAARAMPPQKIYRYDWEWYFADYGQVGREGIEATLSDHAWWRGNADTPDSYGRSGEPRAVGQKKCNDLGLFDLYGNVSEWCLDATARETPPAQFCDAPAREGAYRVCRGGSYASGADSCRSSARGSNIPGCGFPRVGFRLVAVPAAARPPVR
ncbi:MAG: SUMF1/EgtB/PvdO family nonheme iron enzyme [Kiritimatiellae bacterium]|nr:SUMF1/EgtB/PvdO family nonheme iron enzyme [Kiritimatiellia bacterium]